MALAIAESPKLALGLTAATAMLTLVSALSRRLAIEVFLIVALASVVAVDLPRRISIGHVTGGALLTIAIVAAALLLFGTPPVAPSARMAIRSAPPWSAFLGLAALSLAWTPDLISGVQNVLVFVATFLCMTITMAFVRYASGNAERLRRWLTRSLALASLLSLPSVLISGPGESTILGPRPFALVALLGVAWTAAFARLGNKPEAITLVLLIASIGASLSRLALAAGMFVVMLAFSSFRTPMLALRTVALGGAVIAVSYAGVTTIAPLHERFTTGDVVLVGGHFTINVSGRASIWSVVRDGTSERPVFGHGAGAAEDLVTQQFPSVVTHPHNDYLRLVYDYGWVGLFLAVSFLVVLLAKSARSWRDTRSPYSLAATLALIAFAIAMVTDNIFVYLSSCLLLSIILGLSLGTQLPRVLPAPNTSESTL